MAIEDRRQRERAAQRGLITAAARTLAEQDGWEAVTTRRLSAEIEYSQPVIYKHFSSLDAIVDAVAIDGFGELAEALGTARRSAFQGDEVRAVVRAYVEWAERNPSIYDAMFTRATGLQFGAEDTPTALTAGYAELRDAVASVAGDRDVDALAEVFWSALHGLVVLGRGGRLRAGHDARRIDLLVAGLRLGDPAA